MLPLKRQVDILARLTERARNYFDFYKFYVGTETRPHILSQMNDFIYFFRMQEHVFRYALFVELAALFDKDNKAICFHSVLKQAKPNIPNDLFVELSQKLDSASAVAQKVGRLRNKAFAHRDSHEDFDEVFKSVGITLNEIEEIIEIARKISDGLCDHFAVQKPVFLTVETLEDCKRLFGALGSKFDEAP